MKKILTILFLFIGFPANANEIWACDGFTYGDGSRGDPFALTGDVNRYSGKQKYTDIVLKRVSDLTQDQYRIYITEKKNHV